MSKSGSFLIIKGLLLAIIMIVLDQVTKEWIRELVRETDNQKIEILPFFNLVEVWNYGISFGLFQAGSVWGVVTLLFVSTIITLLFLKILKDAETLWVALSCGLIIGGAIGNMIDRVRFAAVHDFLDVHAFGYHWPAFNVADSCVVIGIGMIVIDHMFWAPKRDARESQNAIVKD